MKFLKEWGWLILLAIAAILLLVFTAGKKNILGQVSKEKEIIDAKAEIRKEQIRNGTQAALRKVEEDYEEEISKLDREQRKAVRDLVDHPDDLVDALLRSTL